jgi:hypothetical protein
VIATPCTGLRVWLAGGAALLSILAPPAALAVPDCVDTRPQTVLESGTNGVTSVAAADVDGDGDVDLLSSSANDDKIAWYENDGASPPGFAERVISTNADGASDVHAADLNDDGLMDVLSTSANDDTIAWYQNVGGSPPRFIERALHDDADGASSVFAADIDGDTDVDVVASSSTDATIVAFLSNLADGGGSAPSFTEFTISTSAFGASSVFAADVDGDGIDDVLSAARFDDEIAWYRPFGPTCDDLQTACETDDDCIDEEGEEEGDDFCLLRAEAFVVTSSADGASSVFALDLDGDGDVDVLSASTNDGEIAWYEAQIVQDGNDTTVEFVKRIIASDAAGAASLHAADLDGDGDPDVLAAARQDGTIAWYEQDSSVSPPQFTKHVLTSDAAGANTVLAVRLDDTGDTDFDVVAASAVTGQVASLDRIRWFENDDASPGTFHEHVVVTGALAPNVLLLADVDGGGDPDVLVASASDGKIAWLVHDGGVVPSFTERVVTLGADEPVSLFLADVDGVGGTDIVAALDGEEARIVWLENLGPLCDDLATACATDADCVPAGRGPCFPRYAAHTVSTNLEAPASVFAVDLDQDPAGDVDLLSASREDDKIAWYENTGGFPPGWVERVISTAADGARSVFAADLDGDGDRDVLSASANDDTIAWYENLGGSPPAFEERPIATNADGARVVLALDVDQDAQGRSDVVSASSNDDRVAWHENLGQLCDDLETPCVTAGTCADPDPDDPEVEATCERRWVQRTIGLEADFIQALVAADLGEDANGDPDFVTASSGDDSILWFENLGFLCTDLETPCTVDTVETDCDEGETCALRWMTHGVTTSAESARSVAVGHLDGDAAPDVLSGFLYGVQWHKGDAEELCVGFDGSGDKRIDGVEVIWTGMAFADSCVDPGDPDAEWWAAVDVNGDCFIDGEDLAILTSRDIFATCTEEDPDDPGCELCSFNCK